MDIVFSMLSSRQNKGQREKANVTRCSYKGGRTRHGVQPAAELLDASGAFGDVPVEVLNELAGRVRVRTVPRGGVVLRQGEVADACYLVRSGRFEVVEERGVHGQVRVLRTIGRGEGFGEYGLLNAARRTATVRACTRGELYTLDKGSFERLLAGRAVVAGSPRPGSRALSSRPCRRSRTLALTSCAFSPPAAHGSTSPRVRT
jgi:hypothetical protein